MSDLKPLQDDALASPPQAVAPKPTEKVGNRRHPVSAKVKREEWCFVLGITNLLVSTWLISAYPHVYCFFHSMKMSGMLAYRLLKFTRMKWEFFLLDWCYIVNCWSVFSVVVAVLVAAVDPLHVWYPAVAFVGPTVFRAFYTWCVGPLALSVAFFRNSLIFHSSDQAIILAVHFSPNLAIYGMRWWAGDLHAFFGDTFPIACRTNVHIDVKSFHAPQELLYPLLYNAHTDTECPASFHDLVSVPTLLYLLLWTVPYSLFFFVFGRKFLEAGGYHTMYNTMKDTQPLKSVLTALGGHNEALRPFIYMSVHFLLCAFSFVVLAPLLWRSFFLHTVYLLALLMVAIFNSSTFYFEVFVRKQVEESQLLTK